MALAPQPEPESSASPVVVVSPVKPATSATTRIVAAVLTCALGGFIVWQAPALYREWAVLRQDLGKARASAVIGYPGIQPAFSHAEPPTDWVRHEGDTLLLWSGWKHGVGHTWFKLPAADIDTESVSPPMGRDCQRAIDSPIVELGGGELWGRVPDEARVAAGTLGGVETAYPVLVLDKVLIINDSVGPTSFLVTYSPNAPDGEIVAIHESVLGGKRVTMGATGYEHNGKPLLYDRGTESLWAHAPEGLVAVSGAHKGAKLKRSGAVKTVAWGDWRSEHPSGRLVVGADRSKPRPEL